MCGRTACTLAPDDICKACGHRTRDGHWVQPQYLNSPDGKSYYPSYNLSPTAYSPVLLSAKHANSKANSSSGLDSMETECEWVVQPMRWGLIPSWHQGDISSIEYKMNNARSDGLMSKASFKKPLERGRRCVVLADGYYEWHRSAGKIQPYFVYFPAQSKASSDCGEVVCVKDEPSEFCDDKKDLLDTTADSKDKKLLTMAGVFDVWQPKNAEHPMYSYAVITVDAHEKVSWMHDRMPAILNGEEEIQKWLDHENVPILQALQLIRPTDGVAWHAVSSEVNNSRNKSENCIKPYVASKEVPKKASASANVMKAWLSTAPKRSSSNEKDSQSTDKKPKV